MSFYVMLCMFLILCFYLGQVMGMMIHCDNCSDFKGLKKYVHMIPFLRVALFFVCLYECIRDKDWKFFVAYMFTSGKNVMIMCAMVETLPELQRIEQRKALRRELSTSPIVALKSILFDTQSLIGCKTQIM